MFISSMLSQEEFYRKVILPRATKANADPKFILLCLYNEYVHKKFLAQQRN